MSYWERLLALCGPFREPINVKDMGRIIDAAFELHEFLNEDLESQSCDTPAGE